MDQSLASAARLLMPPIPPTFKAHDAQFANYLGNAGTELGVVASPIGRLYERKAATGLGKVNGYCKYDVGVQMGYSRTAWLGGVLPPFGRTEPPYVVHITLCA